MVLYGYANEGMIKGDPKMPTFTVKQFETNTYYLDTKGKWHPVEKWDCGHKHRTVAAAEKCRAKLSGTTRSINAVIINNDTDDIAEWERAA